MTVILACAIFMYNIYILYLSSKLFLCYLFFSDTILKTVVSTDLMDTGFPISMLFEPCWYLWFKMGENFYQIGFFPQCGSAS